MDKTRTIGLIILLLISIAYVQGKLTQNFYSSSCPNVEAIVKQAVNIKFQQTFITAQGVLRMFFHDCFVQGCDASIMIFSPNGDAERDASDNVSLPEVAFDTVNEAKEAVEAECPGVVSCADIISLATRDVVFMAGGPFYRVELGRLDGLVSKASLVEDHLPGPDFNFDNLKLMFAKHNLNEVDLVALSGAHTIGVSHCSRFADRLYDFSPSEAVDPELDDDYAQQLMQVCPPDVDPGIVVGMDPDTPTTFDNLYFQNLIQGKGMFTSDAVLFSDSTSRPIVQAFAGNGSEFNSAFVEAMTKLGRVGVKTGKQGEIRRDCTMFN